MYNQDFDVYISFAQEDSAKVQRIVDELEWAGIKVWFHHQPEASADSIAVLTQQLPAGRAHIVVWSNDSAASGRIQAEARTSSAQNRLIAARIDPVLPPKGTKAEVYADLVDWKGGQDHRGMKKILHTIFRLTGKGVAPEPGEESLPDGTDSPSGNPEWDRMPETEKDERAWQIAINYNNKTYYEHYLSYFPNGKYAAEAKTRLEKKKRTGRIILTCAVIYFIVQIIFSLVVNLANL